MIGYFMLLMIFLALFLLSRKMNLPKELDLEGNSSLEKSLIQMSYYVFQKIITGKELLKRKQKGRFFLEYENKVNQKLFQLSPGENKHVIYVKYYLEKIRLSLLLLLAGGILGLLVTFSANSSQLIKDGEIERKSYGRGQQEAVVDIINEDGTVVETNLTISAKEYTTEQLDVFLEECIPILEKEILDENISISKVTKNLNFPKKLQGYPFKIKWKSSNPRLVKHSGEVLNEESNPQGEIVMLEATFRYGDYEYIYEFACEVYPKEYTEEEIYQQEIEKAIQKADEATITEDTYYLPETIHGKRVSYKEKISNQGPVLCCLCLLLGICLYFVKDQDLSKKLEERKEQMMIDYSEIVSKITLLVGAGMPLRAAFRRIVEDYLSGIRSENKKRYAYEEMLITLKEIEAGVSEVAAYERFGKRCGIQQYVKFAALLSQNVKKGTQGFIQALENESKDALQERRNNARIQGEKAGTKLLVPMILMLFVVLLMIMVPAFSSFG